MRRHSKRPLPDIKQNPDKNASQRKRKNQSAPPGIENSPRVSQLKKFQHLADNSHKVLKLAQFQRMADKHVASREKPLQLKSAEDKIIEKKNHTGLPDNLKTGIENLSGLSMDDVKVHYNSEKPAQLHAHAYAQGTDIHLAAGQEKHLPHEAWHVVQQKQGRVQPTMQMKGKINVNDDAGLEREADVMGERAVKSQDSTTHQFSGLLRHIAPAEPVVQGNFTYTASIVLDRSGAAKKKSDQIRVDSIELPETERPPTQYGDKQQAHSVSWTLLKQAYSRMPVSSLTHLLTRLKGDWAELRKQSDIKKNKDAHAEFNQFLHRYSDTFFENLLKESHSYLKWYGFAQKMVTDYFVALQLSALATHTGYVLKIDSKDKNIHEAKPSGHGEPFANSFFQKLEQHLQGNVADKSMQANSNVLKHAKYYWDPGIGIKGGINEKDHVKLIVHKYETAFSRAFPTAWENYKATIQTGLSQEALKQVEKFSGKKHSEFQIEKIEEEDQEDVGLEEHNTGGFQASVKLSEQNAKSAAPASAFEIAFYEIVSIALPNDRPVTKYGVIGQKSHTISWTLVTQSLRALGANKHLSTFLQALLTRWEDLQRQDWGGMIGSNLISGADLVRRKILGTVLNVTKYNKDNAARLTGLKNKIPEHIAMLHRMVKGESFTDVQWAHIVQQSIADYVIVYQSSPLATYKSEPNPKGHGEPDANEWLGSINKNISATNKGEVAKKYFNDVFKRKNRVKSKFKGNDLNDRDRAVELGALHQQGLLTDAHHEEIEQKLIKHLALKYLDVKWTTVDWRLGTGPGQYAQILVEWEEAIEKAYPEIWKKHSAYLKTFAENVVLSNGLQDQQAVKLDVMEQDRKNLQEHQTKLKSWVQDERAHRARKRGLLSIQAGDEELYNDEHAAYKEAKELYKAGREAAHADPDKPVAANANHSHKLGHQDYIEGMTYARNNPESILPPGRNSAFNVGFLQFYQGYHDAKNKKSNAKTSKAYDEGYNMYIKNFGNVLVGLSGK